MDCFDFRLTDFEPSWSPDGRTIAFIHGDTILAHSGIWLVDSSGANKRIILVSPGAHSPTWSADGSQIAFGDGAQIYKMKINGDSLMQLTFQGRNFFPDWSPDGLWIAYDRSLADASGPAGVWIMKPDGSQKQFVFGGAFPAWQYNARSLTAAIGTSSTSIWKRFVRYFPFETVDPETLSAVAGNDNMFPKHSPDGTRIAFTSQSNSGMPQIWTMLLDNTDLRQLTNTQGYFCDWSPNGLQIVYTDTRAVNGRLWLMRNDGTDKKQLTFD